MQVMVIARCIVAVALTIGLLRQEGEDERQGILAGGTKSDGEGGGANTAAPRWFYAGVLLLGSVALVLLAGGNGEEASLRAEAGGWAGAGAEAGTKP